MFANPSSRFSVLRSVRIDRVFILAGVLLGGLLCSGLTWSQDNTKSVKGTISFQKPVAKPTEAQIQRWTKPRMEPVQMLAVREPIAGAFANCTARLPNGKQFVIGGKDVALWSATSNEPDYLFAEGLTSENWITCMSVSADGKRLATSNKDGQVQIWSIEEKKSVAQGKLPKKGIQSLSLSPDGSELAAIGYGSEVMVLAGDTLRSKKTIKLDGNSYKTLCFVAPNQLAVAGDVVSLWDTNTGKKITKVSEGRYNTTLVAKNGGFLYAEKETIAVWNLADNKPESKWSANVANNEIATFDSAQTRLATANGSAFRIWDIKTGTLLQRTDFYGVNIVGIEWLSTPEVIAVVTDQGRIRYLGDAKTAAALEWKPMDLPIAQVDPKSKRPLPPETLLKEIDLRTFPRLPVAKGASEMPSMLSYTSDVSADEAKLFYRYWMGQAGWLEGADPMNPMSLLFKKGDVLVSASFYSASSESTIVTLGLKGTFDCRLAPRPSDPKLKLVFENEATVMLQSSQDILSLEVELHRIMQKAGWIPFSRLNANQAIDDNRRDLSFLCDGTVFQITLTRQPEANGLTSIQYSILPNEFVVPVPPDSTFLEYDGGVGPYLVANTKLSVPECMKHCDSVMRDAGWMPIPRMRGVNGDRGWCGYLRGLSEMLVRFVKQDDGTTRVLIGEEIENRSSQLEKPAKSADASSASQATLEAADFPIAKDATEVRHDPRDKTIEFDLPKVSLADLVVQYSKTMEPLGWKLDKGGVRSEDYTLVEFIQNKKSINMRATSRETKVSVQFEGEGLGWDKPLPGPKKVIPYTVWLKDNRLTFGLEHLDRYEKEMRSLQK